MKTKYSFFVLFIASLSFQNIFAQSPPNAIKTYLNKSYSGWTMPAMPNYCGDLRSNASGDFNGDGKRDYVLRIRKGKNGYIIAFLAKNSGYSPYLFHSFSSKEVLNTGVLIYRKGEEYSTGEIGDEDAPTITLEYDAPFDGVCESDVGGIHYFQNGKFVEY